MVEAGMRWVCFDSGMKVVYKMRYVGQDNYYL